MNNQKYIIWTLDLKNHNAKRKYIGKEYLELQDGSKFPCINKSELTVLMRTMGVEEKELELNFNALDKFGQGHIIGQTKLGFLFGVTSWYKNIDSSVLIMQDELVLHEINEALDNNPESKEEVKLKRTEDLITKN